MDNAVEERGSDFGIVKDVVPVIEVKVSRDDERVAFVEVGDNL
ncbi:hypothetical protein FACS1894208_04410 [Clostridia bacterium]|nr:hypothetical protein FACS1894208_04410 [Clostridia bacterium]